MVKFKKTKSWLDSCKGCCSNDECDGPQTWNTAWKNITLHPVKCNKQSKQVASAKVFYKILHKTAWKHSTQEKMTSSKTYRLTAGLNTLCVKGGNRQNDGNSRRKTEKVEVELYEEQFGGERENDSLRIQKKTSLQRGYRAHEGGGCWTGACVPAEECPLVFGIYSEPKGLLASSCGHGFHGDCLTGGGLFLAFFLVAVWAVGGRAVGRHQGSLSCHTHTPHTRYGEMRGKVICIIYYTKYS